MVTFLINRSSGILGFKFNYRFLSNFWPCKIHWMGIEFKDTESAYQATKVDPELPEEEYTKIIDEIRNASSPGIAKRLGKEVLLNGKQRKDWRDISLDVMYELNKLKFQNPILKKKLIDTGDTYIEETNTWKDTFWGVCSGKGENHLGRILMTIRKELKDEDSSSPTRGESSVSDSYSSRISTQR